jgi:hypothetical protein
MYAQSFKKIQLSSPELLSAKTVGIVTFGPTRDLSYTWWGKPYFVPEGANLPRDREIAEKEIRKWNRYIVVEDPRQADLVMALREWDHHTWRLGNATAVRLVIFRGGPEFERKAEILWSQQMDWVNAGALFSAVNLLCDFRRRVEKLSKANGQPPPRSAGECNVDEYSDNPYWELPKGNPLRDKMYAESITKELAHAPELMSAKTVAIVTFGRGEPKSSQFYDFGVNALRATDEVKEEIGRWKRYILVEDPRQADIVIAVREWGEKGICLISWGCTKYYIRSRLAVFKGGPNFDQDLELLWAYQDCLDRCSFFDAFRWDVDRLSKDAVKPHAP